MKEILEEGNKDQSLLTGRTEGKVEDTVASGRNHKKFYFAWQPMGLCTVKLLHSPAGSSDIFLPTACTDVPRHPALHSYSTYNVLHIALSISPHHSPVIFQIPSSPLMPNG